MTPTNPIAMTNPARTATPPSRAVGLRCGRSLEGWATIPQRNEAAFATGINTMATKKADTNVRAISNSVVNLAL